MNDHSQEAYYRRTAESYDKTHLINDNEHTLALSAFIGMVRDCPPRSILDVGAGTGRGVLLLRAEFEEAEILGIEPVKELREVGHRKGIPLDRIIEGDATALPFPDESFDYVIATGLLHHVANPSIAVSEMLRVAKLGIMISDSNKFGQGSLLTRWIKWTIERLGLWDWLIWAQTRGRMWKWSESDGYFYSYSIFDNLGEVKRKFPTIHLMNTKEVSGSDLKFGAPNIMLFARNVPLSCGVKGPTSQTNGDKRGC